MKECSERSQDKAKNGEKAEFIRINENFESFFNTVLASLVILSQSRHGIREDAPDAVSGNLGNAPGFYGGIFPSPDSATSSLPPGYNTGAWNSPLKTPYRAGR